VKFKNEEDAQIALEKMNNVPILNRPIQINVRFAFLMRSN